MSKAETFVNLSAVDSRNLTDLEKVTKFLFGTFGDAGSLDEAFSDIKQTANRNPAYLTDKLNALEELLQESAYDDFFAHLVAWEANWVLEDTSDDRAKQWLREIAEMIRQSLGDKAPPKPAKT